MATNPVQNEATKQEQSTEKAWRLGLRVAVQDMGQAGKELLGNQFYVNLVLKII